MILLQTELYLNDGEKANAFNKAFATFSQINTDNANIPAAILRKTNSSLSNINVTINDVRDILLNLNPSKASGPDMVSCKMLKETAHSIAPSLTRLISLSLSNKKVPQGWKEANVVPVHKKGNKSDCNNYRPISLLNITAKICERVVFKHLFNYIRDNNLITPHQSGFIPGDSTVNQLAFMYHTFAKALNDKFDIRLVFCDQSKAFDKVWHGGLLYKLKTFGIEGSLYDWFENYLSNRRQRVTIKNGLSTWAEVRAGVPQGSILGPLLFLIHINDIVENIESNIKLFADDTSLYVIVEKNEHDSVQQLNRDLEKISTWADTWLVTFNPDKTKSMQITLKKNINASPVFFNNHILDMVTSHKHLGITFNSTLTWNDHIDSICCKANKKIFVMAKLKNILDRKTLETIYTCFVRPALEYGSIIWQSCTQTEGNRLEAIQLRAAKIITGGIIRTNSNLLYEETKIEKLESRRDRQLLLFFHKLMNDNVPAYLESIKPAENINRHNRNLRNRNDLDAPRSRIKKYEDSLIIKAVSLWNNLPTAAKNIPDYYSFKLYLEKDLSVPNELFYLGKRKINIVMAKIRMKCSNLRAHLFELKIIENAACDCGYFYEDSVHYFFVSVFYTCTCVWKLFI